MFTKGVLGNRDEDSIRISEDLDEPFVRKAEEAISSAFKADQVKEDHARVHISPIKSTPEETDVVHYAYFSLPNDEKKLMKFSLEVSQKKIFVKKQVTRELNDHMGSIALHMFYTKAE